VQYRIRNADGSQRWIYEKGQGIFDAAGDLKWLDGVIIDITERKRAEEQADLLKTLTENSADFIGVADLEGNALYLNQAGRDLVGLGSSAAVAGTKITEYIADKDQILLRDVVLPQIFQTGRWDGELRFRHFGTGRTIPLDCSGFIIRSVTSGKPQFIATVSRDLSERKQAEVALREHGERLELLTHRLVQAQEEEARRIGRELHDDLGQILTTLKIQLQTLPLREAEEKVADLTKTVDQAIERVRTISADLRPTVLDDLGLTAALRWMLDRQTRPAGLKGSVVARGVETRLSHELETTCYRVAQEALTNVVRHARAKSVRIVVEAEEDELHLLVSDDGVGFDTDRLSVNASGGQSLGLLGMKERVELMKGRFMIRSHSGKGTDVHAWFPLPGAAPRDTTPRRVAA
jgi:PAS domain S-box-containing protein